MPAEKWLMVLFLTFLASDMPEFCREIGWGGLPGALPVIAFAGRLPGAVPRLLDFALSIL
jgi:hypothetical protein